MSPPPSFLFGIVVGFGLLMLGSLTLQDGDLWWIDFKDWIRRKK